MKKLKKRRGMVLAAGLGTRLLPITERLPKPLVGILNVPNIYYSLYLLKRAGVEEVIINLHYLPDTLREHLGTGEKLGLSLKYSPETLLLGTGGGLKKAELFFENEPLILMNCDFISNVDLAPFLADHEKSKALATMILWENAETQMFYSKVGVDRFGRLCSLPRLTTDDPKRTGLFTGIHLLEPPIFSYLHEVPSGINEVLYPVLMRDEPSKVFGRFMEDAYWYDTGELAHLWGTSMALLERLKNGDPFLKSFLSEFGGLREAQPGVWLPASEKLPDGIKLHPPVILGKEVHLGTTASVGPYVVLGHECSVGKGAGVSWVVALAGYEIEAEKTTSHSLLFETHSFPMKK